MSTISFYCRPATPNERDITTRYLQAHTEAALGMPITHEQFGLLAYDGDIMIGGAIGKIFLNWVHIDLIWVDTHYQRKGVGTSLMRAAEQFVADNTMHGIEVWTQSWQAPEFYRKLGYHEFAVIDDFTPGRFRHAFRYVRKQGMP